MVMRRLAVAFLRNTARGPLTEALPAPTGTGLGRTLRALLGLPLRLVGRLVGLFLSKDTKARIQEALINHYRIPVNWQPRDELVNHYRLAITYLAERHGRDNIGDYLEFGVYQGNSLCCMHRALVETGIESVRLFGFDSFEGLPDSCDVDGVWSPGQFRCDEEFTRALLDREGVNWDRTVLVRGFFADTLKPALLEQYALTRVGVIMIDSDLYTSAVEALGDLRACGL